MQTVSEPFLQALNDSVTPIFTADVYYDGIRIAEGLPLSPNSSIKGDATAAVRTQCSLVINDPDGRYTPKQRMDPLAPYGQQVNVRAGLLVNGIPETVSLGWFVIQSSVPDEAWRWYKGRAEAVPSGTSIPIVGYDRSCLLTDFKFISTETPQQTTMWAEIVRLAGNLLPVSYPGYDAPIPEGLTYSSDRWAAITDLAKLVLAHPVITPDGLLTLRLDALAASVWQLKVGPDGNSGKFTPSLDRATLHNAVTVQGTDSSGNPITVTRYQDSGPLRWGGPFGCRPADLIVDPLLTSLDQVVARAELELRKAIAGAAQTVDIPAVLNYALELDDVVDVSLPRRSGAVQVTGYVMPIRGAMTVTVLMPADWVLSA